MGHYYSEMVTDEEIQRKQQNLDDIKAGIQYILNTDPVRLIEMIMRDCRLHGAENECRDFGARYRTTGKWER